MAKKSSAPMFAGKFIADCCVNCGEEFNSIGIKIYVVRNKQFCSLNCLHQNAREELCPKLDKFEAMLIKAREEQLSHISLLKLIMNEQDSSNVTFKIINMNRHNGKADIEDPEEQEMFLTKKHQIFGTQLLMVKNLKTRNASAYCIFKGKFQEQYEEYIAITKNSKQRLDESDASMTWLKVMEIFEKHFI